MHVYMYITLDFYVYGLQLWYFEIPIWYDIYTVLVEWRVILVKSRCESLSIQVQMTDWPTTTNNAKSQILAGSDTVKSVVVDNHIDSDTVVCIDW